MFIVHFLIFIMILNLLIFLSMGIVIYRDEYLRKRAEKKASEQLSHIEYVTMIDPPSGWRYGFPKAIPADVQNVYKWLVENGYPKDELDSYGEYFHYRTWTIPKTELKD